LETLLTSAVRARADDTIIYISIRQVALLAFDFVSKGCNFVTLLPKKVIDRELRPFCTVLKFQFDCAVYQRGGASANFGFSNNIESASPTHTQ